MQLWELHRRVTTPDYKMFTSLLAWEHHLSLTSACYRTVCGLMATGNSPQQTKGAVENLIHMVTLLQFQNVPASSSASGGKHSPWPCSVSNIIFLREPEHIFVNTCVISLLGVFFKSLLMHVVFVWLWSMDLSFAWHKSSSVYGVHSLQYFI